jgi:hypothetical protein
VFLFTLSLRCCHLTGWTAVKILFPSPLYSSYPSSCTFTPFYHTSSHTNTFLLNKQKRVDQFNNNLLNRDIFHTYKYIIKFYENIFKNLLKKHSGFKYLPRDRLSRLMFSVVLLSSFFQNASVVPRIKPRPLFSYPFQFVIHLSSFHVTLRILSC